MKSLAGFLLLFTLTLCAQPFRVTSSGNITFRATQTDSSVTVRYNALSENTNLLIAFPFRQTLPQDYAIHWSISATGQLSGYHIYLSDQEGVRWKGVKKLAAQRRGKESVSKAHFSRPSDSGMVSPVSIDSLYISLFIKKKGKGTVTFSRFRIEELYLTAKREMMPVMLTPSGQDIASLLLDSDKNTFHIFLPGNHLLRLDYHNPRSPGALAVERKDTFPLSVTTYRSEGKKRILLTSAEKSSREKIYITLPEHESAECQIEFSLPDTLRLAEISLLPPETNDHPVHLYRFMAEETTPGYYPRGYSGKAAERTLLWKNSGKEVYINSDGQIELPHAGFMIDPFIRILDETGTYLSAKNHLRYAPDSSRVYHVNRAYQYGELWVRAFCDTVNGTPYLNLIYEAANLHHFKIKGKVFIAVRPLGSAPYSAENMTASDDFRIYSAEQKGSSLLINNTQQVHLLTGPQSAGGYAFLKSDYIPALQGSSHFPSLPLADPSGLGTLLLSYDFTLIPASRRLIFLSLPLEKEKTPLPESYRNPDQRMRPYLPVK